MCDPHHKKSEPEVVSTAGDGRSNNVCNNQKHFTAALHSPVRIFPGAGFLGRSI